MHLIRIAVAVTAVLAGGQVATAGSQQKHAKQPPRTIIIDRSINRPPPPPHERTYVGPGPTLVAPMDRIPQVAPLAQPPVR